MDRVERIMIELAKCSEARSQDGEINSVYLNAESIAVIATQAMAMRGEVSAKDNEIRLMKERIARLNERSDT